MWEVALSLEHYRPECFSASARTAISSIQEVRSEKEKPHQDASTNVYTKKQCVLDESGFSHEEFFLLVFSAARTR